MAKRTDLFIRLSLDYANHPKIASLSDAAFRAHVEMILYSRKYETDGVLKNRVVNRLGSGWDAEVVAELLDNDDDAPSLLQLDNGDYELHGFADMQETRAEIAARRRKNADNGKLGGRPRKPKKTQSVTESPPQPQTQSGTQKKAETETETETEDKTSSASAEPPETQEVEAPREDVEKLCKHLQHRIVGLGSKKPNITKAWRDQARLMLDTDKRAEEEAHRLIDWALADGCFWQPHIGSMKKLREKYDTMRLQAMNGNRGNGGGYMSSAEKKVDVARHWLSQPPQEPPADPWAIDTNPRKEIEG